MVSKATALFALVLCACQYGGASGEADDSAPPKQEQTPAFPVYLTADGWRHWPPEPGTILGATDIPIGIRCWQGVDLCASGACVAAAEPQRVCRCAYGADGICREVCRDDGGQCK